MSALITQIPNNLVEELQNLEAERDRVQILINQAQSELDTAKAKHKLIGEYADPEWFSQTKAAIREETVELHNINRKIKGIRAQLSKSNPKASYFQQAAVKILDKETYNKINILANSWMKNTR